MKEMFEEVNIGIVINNFFPIIFTVYIKSWVCVAANWKITTLCIIGERRSENMVLCTSGFAAGRIYMGAFIKSCMNYITHPCFIPNGWD